MTSASPLPVPPHWTVDWDALQDLACIRALKGCPQNPVYHAEGDVWIHTRMVVEAPAADPAWRALPEPERHLVYTAAVLHDIGKPGTTREENGRLTSRGHSGLGERMARALLWELGCPFAEREQICAMIRFHQVPYWLIDEPGALRRVAQLSQTARGDYLTLLATADIRGRITHDQQKLLDNVALFHEFCAENNCLTQPWAFPSDHSRVEYFRHPDRDIHCAAYDDTRSEVVVLSGLPGSGKDHWVRTSGLRWPVISLDGLREELDIRPDDEQGAVIQAARERARQHLRAGEPFIWNATNISRQSRQRVLNLLADYKAHVTIVYVEAPPATLFAQNRDRERIVPPAAINRMIERWELPDITEAHRVVYEVRES